MRKIKMKVRWIYLLIIVVIAVCGIAALAVPKKEDALSAGKTLKSSNEMQNSDEMQNSGGAVSSESPDETDRFPVRIVAAEDDLKTITYACTNANMTLYLPEGWEYEIEEYSEDAYAFGISFWPAGNEHGAEDDRIQLLYYTDMFGVCGTGLETEAIVFESGPQATIGTYDNSPVWSHLVYVGTPGSYVALNSMDKTQWKIYEDTVMDILGNVTLAEGILWEADAIALAEPECTIEGACARAKYDFEAGVWKIHFYDAEKRGTEEFIRIDAKKTVIEEVTE